jgi:hypothetical protein
MFNGSIISLMKMLTHLDMFLFQSIHKRISQGISMASASHACYNSFPVSESPYSHRLLRLAQHDIVLIHTIMVEYRVLSISTLEIW